MSTPAEDKWVHFDEFNGGTVVWCALCGRKETSQTFRTSSLNHAEAFRLATAYFNTHMDSEMHAAAIRAFHGDLPEVDPTELVIQKAFDREPPTEHDLRRRAARSAALPYSERRRGRSRR